MGKHNDKLFQENLKLTFKENLARQFRNGLAQGTYAACKVVHMRLTDETKPIEERVANAVAFCEPIINLSDGKREPPAEKVGE